MTEKDSVPDIKNFCVCGCGEEIPLFSKNRGEPRKFKHGHHSRGQKNLNWKNDRCKHSSGYIQILEPNHPYSHVNGYVFEHRIVMEKYLGRYLTENELVHHVNGNKQDNRIENLKLTNKIDHTSHHKKKDMSHRVCELCKTTKTFIHIRTQYKSRFYPRWHKYYKDKWLCDKCHRKRRYEKEKLRIKNP